MAPILAGRRLLRVHNEIMEQGPGTSKPVALQFVAKYHGLHRKDFKIEIDIYNVARRAPCGLSAQISGFETRAISSNLDQ